MTKKYSIIAPHIDDETIGCFTLLNAGQINKVYYVFETDQERLKEADKASHYFDFKYEILPICDFNKIPKDEFLLVPNIKDLHIHHKMVNISAKMLSNDKLYYSVDMNTLKKPFKLWQNKRDILYHLYRSQYNYFDQNTQCYLFENIVESDCLLTVSIPIKINNFEIILTMVDSVDFDNIKIENIKSLLEREYKIDISPEKFLNKIFQSKIFETYLSSLKLSIKNLETQFIETAEFNSW